MKKLLSILVAGIILLACARPRNPEYVGQVEARDSVYKTQVKLTVDISPLLRIFEEKARKAEEERRKKECEEAKKKSKKKPKRKSDEPKECKDDDRKDDGGASKEQKKKRFALTLSEHQKQLDYRFFGATDGTVEVGWTGTAWVVDRSSGSTFLMTAGHVCETRDFFETWYVDWDTWTIETIKLPIVEKSHTLISRENVEIPTTVLADEDLNEETYAGNDLCLLGSQGDLGTPLPLGKEDPAYGSHSEVIGAPAGLWGGGIAVTADLKFSGRGNVWGGGVAESLAFTGDVVGGNSGSAIMHNGRVVALLNLGGVRFKELTTGIPWEEIRAFFRRHMHRGIGG